MSPEQILALVAALTGEPDPNAFALLRDGGANPDYPVEVTPCSRPVVPDEIEGETVICGLVTVPFDHADPDGETITIAFNLYKAHSLSPEPDPVIYLHGGPGDGTVSRVGWTIGIFEHLRQRRDIIAIDERGVDSSAPEMDCYSTLGAQLEPALELQARGALVELQDEFITACLAELNQRGIDISLINTSQNAMDIPAVMSALGYESYNIYGISYGTKLTQEIMRQDPPGIRSVIIDGNAPPWLPLYSSFWEAHATGIRLSLEPCERDPVCAEAYPDIIARTFALFETLGETPVQGAEQPIDVGVLYTIIDGRGVHDGQFNGLTPYVPLMVTQLEEGDTTIVDQIIAGTLPPAEDTPEAIRAGALAAGLDDTEMALVDAMLAAAEHIRLAEDTGASAARELEAGRDADARGTSIADIFDNELGAAITSLPTAEAQYAAYRDYLNLRFEKPSQERLTEFLATNFEDDTGAGLTVLARQLDEAGLARVFDLIRIDNQELLDAVEGQLQTYIYACQEDFSDGWNSVERLATLVAEDGSWGPGMQENMVTFFSDFITDCLTLFEQHPRENWTVPVSTDLPVLSMNGELDRNTAAIWGQLAIENFSNAQYVQVPEAGHGTILFSQCARDITAAFIDHPESELDLSCLADERAPVMLPDGTMHELPY